MMSQPPPDPSQPYPHNRPYPSFPPGPAPVPGAPGRAAPGRSILGRLGPGQRAALYVGGGTLAVLLLCGVGVTAVGSLTGPTGQTPNALDTDRRFATPTAVAATSGAAAAPAATPTPEQTPVVQTRTVTETRSIPFPKRTVKDSSLAKGKTRVRTRGVAGVQKLTYEVTVTDGVETARKLVRQEVTRQPVAEVVAVGTKETRRCDPNYSGACVPIASDVDCAGGSGNGPAYVTGPVKVIGSDIYDLDRDNDGYGCD